MENLIQDKATLEEQVALLPLPNLFSPRYTLSFPPFPLYLLYTLSLPLYALSLPPYTLSLPPCLPPYILSLPPYTLSLSPDTSSFTISATHLCTFAFDPYSGTFVPLAEG